MASSVKNNVDNFFIKYLCRLRHGLREEETACFESTAQRIRGWWEEIKPYLIAALGSMEVKFGVAVSIGDRLPEIVRAVCNANFWKCTRSVVTARP